VAWEDQAFGPEHLTPGSRFVIVPGEGEELMSQTLILQLPEDIYSRLKQTADAMKQPVEAVAVQSVRSGLPPLTDDLPSEYQEEFRALEGLGDGGLWAAARSQMPSESQRAYSQLLRKNATGRLTEQEQQRLTKLGVKARKLTLRKAHAYALLKWRGHRVPTLAELQKP